MDIFYLGANCLKIVAKKATLFVDPIVSGKQVDTGKSNVNLITNRNLIELKSDKLLIDAPGEYEVAGFSIRGIAARAHMDEPQAKNATIYKITRDNTNVVVMGHVFPKLSDEQLADIGMVDVLVIPVGGNGYTTDSTGATQLVRKIEPKVVIPTHYADKSVKYEVPQADLKLFLDEIGMHPETVDDFKINKNVILPEQLQVVVLNKT